MKKKKKFAFPYWIPLAVGLTMVYALIYIIIQQMVRLSANDPQIQIAEDTATALAGGQIPQTFTTEKVDIEKSLAPYMIIYSNQGQPLTATAQLHNHIPSIPQGVLSYVASHGEDRFTWQPEKGVRGAVVVIKYTGANAGYVLVGRSLREVELREDQLMQTVFGAWIVTISAMFIIVALLPVPFIPKK